MRLISDNGLEMKISFAETEIPHFHEGLELIFLVGHPGGGVK